jgi:hypothetical protein
MVEFVSLERLVINHMHNAVDSATRVLTKIEAFESPKGSGVREADERCQ